MQGIFTSGTWEERSDEISFADFRFSVTHHYLVQESPDKEGKDEELEGMGFLFCGLFFFWRGIIFVQSLKSLIFSY